MCMLWCIAQVDKYSKLKQNHFGPFPKGSQNPPENSKFPTSPLFSPFEKPFPPMTASPVTNLLRFTRAVTLLCSFAVVKMNRHVIISFRAGGPRGAGGAIPPTLVDLSLDQNFH